MGGGGGGEIIYLSLHCHHQNDSFIKIGSDESHVNVSLTVSGIKSQQDRVQVWQREESRSEIEPRCFCLPA